jgi:hypothetical protein
MSETTHEPAVEPSAWVREHQVFWELAPFQETVKGHGVQQTGLALKLFGRFEPGGQRDAEAVAREIHEHLRTLAEDAVRGVPVDALVQVQPFGRAVIPPESRPVVEVELTLVASPPHPEQPLPPAEVRRLIRALEGRLRSLGLKNRSHSAS